MTTRRRRRFTGLCDDDRFFLALLEMKCALAIVELATIYGKNVTQTEDRISNLAIDAMLQIDSACIESTIQELNKASDLYRRCAIERSGVDAYTEHRQVSA